MCVCVCLSDVTLFQFRGLDESYGRDFLPRGVFRGAEFESVIRNGILKFELPQKFKFRS